MKRVLATIGVFSCWLGLLPVAALAQEAALTAVQVYPTEINLFTSRSRQSLVVQATYADGITRDVTAEAKAALTNPALAKLEKHTLYPLADGATELKVEFAGRNVSVPVKIKDAGVDRPISFKLDVMPVFMKAGCNVGGCHGAARGKDGFRLSLFGFDPDGDHYRLTREIPGRRINLAVPPDSLLLEKAIGRVPHTGGSRFDDRSELYQTLMRWLEAGAPQDPPTIPTPVAVELLPKSAVLDGKGATQRMVAKARYSDGSERDVTSLALFLSNNDTSATISPEGVVQAGDRGEAFVMARFATFTVGAQVIVLPKGLKFTAEQLPETNYIDTLVNNKLKKLRIAPSGLCSDEVFLRRAYLDVIGVLPTAEEYQRFLSNPATGKRVQLIDELLGRKEFAELWVLKWAELLQIRSSNQVSYKAMLLYYNWLQDRIARNVPMDQMVQELVGSSGGTFKNPATNYYQNETDTLKVAENVAQVFMGMRIQCAQCHNHPFDRWTQNDYYGFAAFFSQIGRKGTDDPRETIVFNRGGGEVAHPVGGRVMKPKFLGGEEPNCAGKDRREVLTIRTSRPTSPTSSGGTSSAWASSTPWTTSASRTPRRTPNCFRSWASASRNTATTSRSWSATSAPRRRTSGRRRPTPATRATLATSPAPTSAASRRRRSSTASTRSRKRRTSSPACRSALAPCRSPTARSAPTS
jgi:hypothetical protein